VRTVLLLLISWATGLAAYGIALLAVRGEVLSLDNWIVIGAITLTAWLVASVVVTLPVLRLLGRYRPDHRKRLFAAAGVALALVPVWLTIGYWYGWNPRHLLVGETAFLAAHYATCGLVLSLALARQHARPDHR
jgi:hypothetical protein